MLHIAMDVKRVQYRTPGGRGVGGYGKKGAVCKYWLQGRCNRNPCKFVHGEVPKPTNYMYHWTTHTYHQTLKQLSHEGRPNSKRSSVLTNGGGGTTNKGDGTRTKNPDPEPKQSSCLTNEGDGPEENGTAKHSHENSDSEPQYSSFLTSRGDAVSLKDTQQSTILGICSDRDKCHYHENSDPEPQDSSFLASRGDAISQKDTQQSMILGTCNDGDKCDSHENCDPEPQDSSFLASRGDAISQKDTQQSMILGTCNDGDKCHSHENSDPEPQDSSILASRGDAISQKDTQQSTILGTCNDGDKCQCLNPWFMGEGVSRLAQLEGHKKAVTGIALPLGSDKLYTGSGDGVVRVWDCHTGQCVNELNLGSEIGCLISDGSWIFVGLRNLVKVWNIQTATEYSLDGPVGQVYALETTGKDMLFAGMQDGSILVWKFNPEINSFQLITTLKGHARGVLSLKVGRRSLYSGSMDNTIRRWDLDTLQCAQTLTGHSAAVMSLLCWENCLLSCSLDRTIKAWAYTEDGCLEVIHTHNEEHGVLVLFGMHDADKKPILFSSCNDNSVHLYELPGFTERGKIFAKQEVGRIESGPGGLVFTGDGAGGVAVWKWLSEAATAEAD